MLLLFDIDGTLITSSGAGMRAMDDAFARIYGVVGASQRVHPDGKTDPAIIDEMIQGVYQRSAEAGEIGPMLQAYLDCLVERIRTTPKFVILPGLPTVLERARQRGDVLGLATGNVKGGARIKLRRAGLLDFFGGDADATLIGGFACDHRDRTELTRVGIERGHAAAGRRFAEAEVVVIGDTPRDVAAAHGAGVRCVAVATGGHDGAALRAAGADVVVETLETLDSALEALGG